MFLLDLGLLSPHEQSAMYLQPFSAALRSQIELRLQIQYPDHSASPIHPINAIFEAAQWVSRYPSNQRSNLTPPMPSEHISPTAHTPSSKNTPPAIHAQSLGDPSLDLGYIKSRDLSTIASTILKLITDAISDLSPSQPPRSQGSQPASDLPANATNPAQITPPVSPTSISRPIASILTVSTVISIPMTQDAAEARIQAIEDELRILQAQSDSDTPEKPSNRSTAHFSPI
jgi:hypothetical protein